MKKRMISVLLAACMLLTMLPGTALAILDNNIFTANITVGGNPDVSCTFKVLTAPNGTTPGTVQIGDGTTNTAIKNDTAGALVIPASVTDTASGNTYNITAIGPNAFARCYSLTSLSFEANSNLTTIGKNAFFACKGLTGSLALPDSVTVIGDSAFQLCEKLDGTLTLPAGVTTISGFAFANCSKLTGGLNLPESVTDIGSDAFAFCRSLNGTLTLPEKLTSIKHGSFAGCEGLTGSLKIPDGVTAIGDLAFQHCSGLTGNLIIPVGVTTIGNQAFERCSGFTGNLSIPAGVTAIGNWAFSDCSGLTSLSFEAYSQLASIGDNAFSGKSWFTGKSGFTGNITIPANVSSVGSDAFSDNSGLTSVTFLSKTAPTLAGDPFDEYEGEYYIYVPYEGTGYDSSSWTKYGNRLRVNAAVPVITNDLSTTQVEYNQNAAASALDATATSADGGAISYAWFSNSTSSTAGATALGETNATYTPSTTVAGITYYYCVVNNIKVAKTGTTTAQAISAIANIKVNAAGGSNHNSSTAAAKPVITVSEVKSKLFSNAKDIKVEADVNSAFGQSVTVKLTDDIESQKKIFSLAGANDRVYPFDISLYSIKSNEKIQPKEGYSVKITLPIPEELLDDREKIKVVYGKDGSLETLKSNLFKKDGKWYISFEAVHFSPYALIVSEESAKPWANPFSDANEDDWYYSAVQYVVQNGLMNGTESNIFSPGCVTNRGMIATILYRLSGSSETSQSTFNDVNTGAYYANAVAWAQQKGIISGYGNGMFGPDDSITREQLSAMLWKYAGSPVADDSNGLTAFQDNEEISSYAKNALTWAKQQGIINGKGEGLLDPKGKATRAEVAQIIQNFMQKSGISK